MDKRLLLVAGVMGTALVATLFVSASCWGRKSAGSQPGSEHAAVTPTAVAPGAVAPTTTPATSVIQPSAPVAVEAEPVAMPTTTSHPGSGRTVVAADGLSGSAPAPTVGKPVAPVDLAWVLRRDPVQAVWTVTMTLTPASGGQRLIATVTARSGAQVISGASTVLADPQPGHAYQLEAQVAARGAAALVVGIRLEGVDVRGRTITIPLPAPDGVTSGSGTPPMSSPAASPASPTAPSFAQPAVGAAPSGVIHGDGVILHPAQR